MQDWYKMANIRAAIKELRRYYGLNATNPYLRLSNKSSDNRISILQGQSTVFDDFVNYTQSFEDFVVTDFMDRILTKSNTAPGVRSILERMHALKSDDGNYASNIPLLITPYESFDALSNGEIIQNPLINSPVDKNTRQGSKIPKNKNYYTFNDASLVNDVKASVIQIFSPLKSHSASDSDIASIYLNSVNSLEASRAVPYLDVSIATAVGVDENQQATPISLGRFLGLDSKANLIPGTADHALVNGLPITSKFKIDIEPTKDKEGNPIEDIRLVTGIEIFTMPQTLVNADTAYNDLIPNGRVLDPFQPLLSLENLKLSIQPAAGLIAQRHGELTMILHDRARMDEVASLISPSKYGKTRLIITYGYAHPAGQEYSSPTSNNQVDNAVGVLIDNMKVTDVFMITNISFSFSNQVVKINLQLATVGYNELSSMDIVYAEQPDIKNIKEMLEVINQGIAESNEITTTKKITSPIFLSNPNTIAGAGLTNDQLKALKELKKANYSGINQIIEQLFGKNGKGGIVANAVKNKNQQLENTFTKIMSTPDPFLPVINVRDVNTTDYVWNGTANPNKNTKTYVSLGKIISTFVGSGIVNDTNANFDSSIDELQIIFHPFNSNAGGLQDYNIAQFVIDFDEFKEVIKANFDITGSMSLMKFLGIIKSFFLSDLGAIGYGLLDSKQRKMFKLDPKKGGRAPAPKKTSTKKKSDSANNTNSSSSANFADQGGYTPAAGAYTPSEGFFSTNSSYSYTSVDPANNQGPINQKTTPETQKKQKSTKTKSYEEVLEASKKENLSALYESSPSASVTFQPPDIDYYIECIPKSIDWDDNPNKTQGSVIKLNIIDRLCSSMSQICEFIRTTSSNSIIPLEKRPTNVDNFPYTSAHSIYSANFFQKLTINGLIKPINLAEIKEEIQARKETLEIENNVLEDIARNYVLFNGDINNAKDIIKKSYPSLIYGSEASGLLTLSFSSENDPGLTDVNLVRQGREEDVHSNDKDGVPMMVMPASITVVTLGCPYLTFPQFYYIDLGTNTDVDNVYSISSVDHTIESGKFTSSIKFTHFMSYGAFRPLGDEFKRTALAGFLAKFNVKKPSKPKSSRKKTPSSQPAASTTTSTTAGYFTDYDTRYSPF